MKEKKAVIGIDIGGTKISAALFTIDGDILTKKLTKVSDKRGDKVIEEIANLTNTLIGFARDNHLQVYSVGACVPGIYNPVKKTAWAPNIPGWDHIPLLDNLIKRLDSPTLKIHIESDRSCYILGEVWKGCAQGCSDAIFIAVGTGIGAGIISNGNILTGVSGIAGAISWMALDTPYDHKYDPWGNLEHYASGHGIARSATEMIRKKRDDKSLLDDISAELLTAHDVFRAYDEGDVLASKVFEKSIKYWGMAVANLVSIFNPQKVIFGGGVFGPAGQFLELIEEEARKWAQPLSFKQVSIELSTLKGDAGLIGAGYLALSSLNRTDED